MKPSKIPTVALAVALAGFAGTPALAAGKVASKAAPVADKAAEGWSAPRENRIHRYTYSPDIIYRILTKPSLHTHIELGEDEGLKEN